MTQFAYSKIVKIQGENGEPVETAVKESLNLNKVIRSIAKPDGTLMVIMDDGYEISEEVPVRNKKGTVELQRQRNRYQSEIPLNKEDSLRFLEHCM